MKVPAMAHHYTGVAFDGERVIIKQSRIENARWKHSKIELTIEQFDALIDKANRLIQEREDETNCRKADIERTGS